MRSSLQIAVLRTVLYADVFRFAMTRQEILHFLIYSQPVTEADLFGAIDMLCAEDDPLLERHGYICLASQPDLIELRREREIIAANLMPTAARFAGWLGLLPFIRMVALTGALAVHNPSAPDDDIDYLLVTVSGRVWLARAFSILLVRLARMRGYVICPNYVLAESALVQDRTDLFIAHELAQMLPMYGEPLYWKMRDANPWTTHLLPNATGPLHPAVAGPQRPILFLKRALEWLLSGRAGDALEAWERRRKLRRFARDLRTPHHAARLDSDHVKGHFNDHGQRVLQAYAERLAAYQCADETAAAD